MRHTSALVTTSRRAALPAGDSRAGQEHAHDNGQHQAGEAGTDGGGEHGDEHMTQHREPGPADRAGCPNLASARADAREDGIGDHQTARREDHPVQQQRLAVDGRHQARGHALSHPQLGHGHRWPLVRTGRDGDALRTGRGAHRDVDVETGQPGDVLGDDAHPLAVHRTDARHPRDPNPDRRQRASVNGGRSGMTIPP